MSHSNTNPAYGTAIMPSIVAVTAFAAVKQSESLSDLYKEQMEQAAETQEEQDEITEKLANAIYATVEQQAEATENNAWGSLTQGSIGIATPVGSTIYEKAATDSSLSTKLDNVTAAEKAFNEGKVQGIYGVAAPEQAITAEEFKGLLDPKTDFTQLDGHTTTQLELLGKFKSVKEGSDKLNEIDPEKRPEALAKGQIARDVEKKLKAQKKDAKAKFDSHSSGISRRSQQIDQIGMGLAPAGAVGWQVTAANAQREQADAESVRTNAQFVSDSAAANIQTQKQTAGSIMEDERSVLQNTIGGLAAAARAS